MADKELSNSLGRTLNFIYVLLILLIIFFGIFVRTKVYLLNAPFWLDEVYLVQSFLDRDISGMFLPLEANQKAPPLFLMFTYIVVKMFGFNEYSFRLIPYVSSILSLFGFLVLLKKFLKHKFNILLALFLFSISMQMIYFSAEFKPYSLDVLICILLLISYKYINLKEISLSKVLLYSIISAALCLLSFPAGIIIFSMLLAKYIEQKGNVPKYVILIIFSIFISYLYLCESDIKNVYYMINWWSYYKTSIFDGFCFLLNNYSEWFRYTFPIFLLLSFYAIYKEKNKYFWFFVLMFIIPMILSFFHIYPFSKRLILFLLPVIIIMIVYLFETEIIFNNNLKMILKTALIILILSLILKIPFFIIPCNNLIEQTYDIDRSLVERNISKELSLFALNNIKETDKVLTSLEFLYYIKYYKKLYDYKTDISFEVYDDHKDVNDLKRINKETKSFIENNKNKSKIWILSSGFRNGLFSSPPLRYCMKVFEQNNLKYKVNFPNNKRLFIIYSDKD